MYIFEISCSGLSSTNGFPKSPDFPISELIGISPKNSLLNSSAVLLTPPSPKILYFLLSPIGFSLISNNLGID